MLDFISRILIFPFLFLIGATYQGITLYINNSVTVNRSSVAGNLRQKLQLSVYENGMAGPWCVARI